MSCISSKCVFFSGLETYLTVHKPAKLKGDIEGVKIKDISAKVDCVLALSDNGELFGWGNSEYHQLSMVTQETQVSVPRRLPVRNCGKVTRIAAGGSMCAIINGKNVLPNLVNSMSLGLEVSFRIFSRLNYREVDI